jgi:hypothetical protein
MRRGDNIPSVSDYAHWNEEAEAMWYAENRYDMENADEILDDWEDNGRYFDPDPDIDMEFDTEKEAREFFERPQDWGYDKVQSLSLHNHGDKWYVDGFTEEYAEKCRKIYYGRGN